MTAPITSSARPERAPWRFALGFTVLLAGCLDPDEPGNLVPKTVDEDTSLPSLELNGTKLHVETFGDPKAPVIVVLHSGPGHDYRGLLRLRRPVEPPQVICSPRCCRFI